MFENRITLKSLARQMVFLAGALVLSQTPVAAAEPGTGLEPHVAEYAVKIKVLKGAMVTGLEATDEGFVGTSAISPRGFARLATKGSIENRSVFRLGDDGVQPLAFSGKDTISKRKKLAELEFDWDAQRVTGVASEKKSGERVEVDVDEPVEEAMHDAISLQYALMHDLQHDGLRDQYVLIDGGKRKVINITALDKVLLRVPFGEFDVLPVQHQVEGSSRVTTFWLAQELNYLPVKIEQHRKGKRLMRAELGSYRPTAELSSLNP